MQITGPEFFDHRQLLLPVDYLFPIHPRGRLPDLGQSVRLHNRVDVPYRAEMPGKRGINTRNTDKYCDYKDCQKTHVFPAGRKSCKCSGYGPLLTFFRGCDVFGIKREGVEKKAVMKVKDYNERYRTNNSLP